MAGSNYEKAAERAKEYNRKAGKFGLFVAGICFLGFVYFTVADLRFYLGSTVAEATVTGFSVESTSSRRGRITTNVRAKVAFQDSAGTPQTGKIGTTNGFVFDPEIGQELQIRYNPDMDKYVKVNRFIPFWLRSIFTLALVLVALGVSRLFTKMTPPRETVNYFMSRM